MTLATKKLTTARREDDRERHGNHGLDRMDLEREDVSQSRSATLASFGGHSRAIRRASNSRVQTGASQGDDESLRTSVGDRVVPRFDPYADQRAYDGGFAQGWRIVREGGRIKAGGRWYGHDDLLMRVGDRVHVLMTDYWGGHVTVSGGAIGCMHRICKAKAE